MALATLTGNDRMRDHTCCWRCSAPGQVDDARRSTATNALSMLEELMQDEEITTEDAMDGINEVRASNHGGDTVWHTAYIQTLTHAHTHDR